MENREGETSVPIIKPISRYEDVCDWQRGTDDLCVAKFPRARIKEKNHVAKTLVCHDMKGGYLDDRFVQGSADSKAYCFYHWEYIDMFVYFSHHLVTIPPPCWTNAGHRHGVKVLGTLITEWTDGFKCCQIVLESEDVYQKFADKLVDIADYYKFDGWLVNIENTIEKWRIDNLVKFLKYLTKMMHERLPQSVVLWYDSVVDTGELSWQNELNDKNSVFFESCDGIYLNYNWTEDLLDKSKNRAVNAGRPFDVFAGIDVFGRGTPGGGGYNTREALCSVHERKLSAAIFAQGWVYETHEKEEFISCENRFWCDLHDLCEPNKFIDLPIVTSFCQGYGEKYCIEGKTMGSTSWSNLSLQQLQPHLPIMQVENCDDVTVHFDTSVVYQGGMSLLIERQNSANNLPFTLRLFLTEIPLKTGIDLVLVSMETKEEELCLLLDLSRDNDRKQLILESQVLQSSLSGDGDSTQSILPKIITETNGWKSRHYSVQDTEVKDWILCSISLRCSPKSSHVCFYLGQIKVLPSDFEVVDPKLQEVSCELIATSGEDGETNCYKLSWSDPHRKDVDYYNIYVSTASGARTLLSHTSIEKCIISLQNSNDKRTLTIQPILKTGRSVRLESCTTCPI